MRRLAFEFDRKIKHKGIITTEDEFDELLKKIDESQTFVIDIEGTKEELLGIGFALLDKTSYYIPLANIKTSLKKDLVLSVLNNFSNMNIIGHNIKYDLKILGYNKVNWLDVRKNLKFEDTQILAWVLDSRRVNTKGGLSLNGLCSEYGIEGKTKKFNEVDIYDVNDIGLYCMQDCLATLNLFNKLYDIICEDEKLYKIYRLEADLIPYIAILELRGVLVSIKKVEELEKYLEERTKEIAKELEKLTGEKVNLRSNQQVLKIIPSDIKNELPLGKTGISTRRDYLMRYQGNEVVDKLLQFRSYDKIQSTFGKAMIKKADKIEGDYALIRAEFRQDGTVSGRFKSQNPNLQNIPKRAEEVASYIRNAFVPRIGHKFIQSDASQIELRCLALVSKDKKLMDIFNSDGDLHQATADALGISRHAAKTVNFSIVYGVSPKSLSINLGISEREAQEIIDGFFEEYKSVKRLKEYIRLKLESKKEIRTYFGRRRLFDFEELTDDIFRQAFNFVCQGTAIDIVKYAMLACYRNKEIEAVPVLQVHDEVVFEAKEEIAEEQASIIKSTMESAVKLPIKIIFDVEIKERWGS